MEDSSNSRWPKPEAQSALVVLVPEAERLVGAFRTIHDPAAAAGVPAHITVLYPFQSPAQITATTVERLQSCFRRFAPIDFALTNIRRFPGVLYLAPEPAEPFQALTLAIWASHPEFPPYEGKHPDIVPHLTVAAEPDREALCRVADEFEAAAQHALHLLARATRIALMDNNSGLWRVIATVSLDGEQV